MTIIEDYSVEGVAEVLSVLRERLRRTGGNSFQITSKSIADIINERFGMSRPAARLLICFIFGYLEGAQIVEVWDRKESLTIYTVNAALFEKGLIKN